MTTGIVLRKHGALTSMEHVDAFVKEGRPAFILCSLTTEWFTQPDGNRAFQIYVRNYDVSLWRKRKRQ